MNNYIGVYLTLLVAVFISCKTEDSRTPSNNELIFVDSIAFPLDEFTSSRLMSFKLSEIRGRDFITFFNEVNATLYFYNAATFTVDKKVVFEVEGPNGIGKPYDLSMVVPITLDSTLIINAWAGKVMLFEGNKKVKSDSLLGEYGNYQYTPTVSPIVFPITQDSIVYIPGYPGGRGLFENGAKGFTNILSYNLNSGTQQFGGIMDPVFSKGFLTQNSTSYSPRIFSLEGSIFGANSFSNFINKFGGDGVAAFELTPSNEINSALRTSYPYNFKNKLEPWKEEPEKYGDFQNWDMCQSSFGSVYTMKDGKQIVRFVHLGRTEEEVKKRKPHKFAIVVYNNAFQYKNHFFIKDRAFDYDKYFVYKDYVYFCGAPVNQKDENNLWFYRYKIPL